MAVQVGDVILDERLLLRGLFDSPLSQTTQTRLLSGGLHVYSKTLTSRNLSISTDGPNGVKHGLFTRSQLNQLASIRDSATTVNLIHGVDTFEVIIPSDGISVEAVIERSTKNAGDRYTGTISFIEV